VHRAKAEMPYVEFLKWVAFESVEPGDPFRGDARSALIASVIANVNRDPKRKSTPFTIDDFMLKTEPTRPNTEAKQKEIRQRLEMWRTMQDKRVAAQEKRAERIKAKTSDKALKQAASPGNRITLVSGKIRLPSWGPLGALRSQKEVNL